MPKVDVDSNGSFRPIADIQCFEVEKRPIIEYRIR